MKTKMISKEDVVRNFIFGVEDSLVSTCGLLSGVAVADIPRKTIILTGIVLIFVEAFSMGVGSFLSDQTADEYSSGQDFEAKRSIPGGFIMFLSYFFAGVIPLYPYLLFEANIGFGISIASSLIALFLLGTISAIFYKHKDVLRHGARMLFIGGGATIIGVIVGQAVNGI